LKLAKTDIEAIAERSRFLLTEEEKDELTEFLSGILEYFDKINAIDTGNTEPAAIMNHAGNRMRDDVAMPSLQQDAILGNAADIKDGFFYVPYALKTGL